jgi:hypothetical protein
MYEHWCIMCLSAMRINSACVAALLLKINFNVIACICEVTCKSKISNVPFSYSMKTPLESCLRVRHVQFYGILMMKL